MDITEKIEIALNEAFEVEEFDDVKQKTSKKSFKVVEITTRGSLKVYTLRPLEKGKNTAEHEFTIDAKKFFKEYISA